jgi:NAD(P)-dependent dehydrogenase (short-subunit alcohol dehydrogenase family)/catechol 2,3-dioxygenase-like lactoylglutathione lyase family enzyme
MIMLLGTSLHPLIESTAPKTDLVHGELANQCAYTVHIRLNSDKKLKTGGGAMAPDKTTNKTQTALITGASRGLGLALARELAHRGWNLIIDGRNAKALEAARAELAANTNVVAIDGDVTDPVHRAAIIRAAQALGGLDVLMNNASTLGSSPRPDLLDYPLDTLEAVFRTNVIAPLALIQAARSTLKASARIINVSSDAGVEPYAGWGGYGASKAALEQLTAILAAENPAWRVYWVDPGDMRTEMHQEAFPGEDISDRDLPEDSVPGFIELFTGDLPSGRYRAKALHPQETSEAKPNVEGLRLVLTVTDFDKATALYRDQLGLPAIDQWITPESHGILLEAGHATLELVDEGQAAEVDQIEVGKRSAGEVRVAYTVRDLDAAANAAKSPDVTAISGAVLTPWNDLNQRLRTTIHPNVEITLSQEMGAPEISEASDPKSEPNEVTS